MLADGPLTREALGAAITRRRGFGHTGEALASGWGTLLKPLAWQGDLCFGPSQGSRVTFTLPSLASARWAGLPSVEEAAPIAIAAYLGAYGPATADSFGRWIGSGRISKRLLRSWFDELGHRVAQVEVSGDRAYILKEHLDALRSTKPTGALRLLPGFDQFVMGPSTADGHVTPAKRRAAVSKQAGRGSSTRRRCASRGSRRPAGCRGRRSEPKWSGSRRSSAATSSRSRRACSYAVFGFGDA